LLTDGCEGHHRLDTRAVASLKRGEAQLARVAQVHDAAGDADLDTRLSIRLQIGELRAYGGDGRRDRKRNGVGLVAALNETLTLGETHLRLLRQLRLGGLGGG